MMKKHEKLKQVLVWGVQILIVAAVLGFGYFAIYTDLQNPEFSEMTFSAIVQNVDRFRSGLLTADEMKLAREALFLLLGALGAGMLISAIGMFYAAKHPESKWVRWLLSDAFAEKNEDKK